MNKLFTKIAGVTLGFAMAIGVGVAVNSTKNGSKPVYATAITGTKITSYQNIESGKTYYIGATNGSGTDYLLSVPSTAATGVSGTAITDMDNATPFKFTGSGTSWKIQFENDNYLTLANGKANGKVNVQTGEATWTASNKTNKFRLSANDTYSLQKNNSGTQFGSYANTQTDIWLIEVPTARTVSGLTVLDGNADELSDGDDINLVASNNVASAEVTCEVSYTTGDPDGNVDIECDQATGFSFDTDDNSTYTLSFTKNGDYNVTISAHEDDSFSMTVSYHVSGISAINYELYSGDLTEGDYVVCSGTSAMKNVLTSAPRIDAQTVTVTDDKITNPSSSIVWHIAKDGDYWTFYNAAIEKYAAFNTTDGRGTFVEEVTDYAKFSVDGEYDFINVGKTTKNYLRYNSGYGFASYQNSTGAALTLYKKNFTEPAIEVEVTGSTSLSVGGTATLTASKINGATGTVTWTKNNDHFTLSATTGDSITVTGATDGSTNVTASLTGGSTVEPVVTTFTVTKQLSSIAVTTAPTKTTYTEGETFDNAGMVITATFDDSSVENPTDYTWSPDGALTPSDTYVTISWGGKTVNQPITVNAKQVDHIKVKTLPTKNEYHSGDEFESAGLVITVCYNEGETDTADITSGFTIEPASYTFTDSDELAGKKTFTVTYSGKSTTFDVAVTSITGPLGKGGRFYIMTSDFAYGLNAVEEAEKSPAVIDMSADNQLTAFDVTLVADNEYTITTTINETLYYLVSNTTATSSNNNQLRITSEPDAGLKSLNWSLFTTVTQGSDSYTIDVEGAYFVRENTVGTTNRYLSMFNNQDWRGYNNVYNTTSGAYNGDPQIQFVAEGSYAAGIVNSLTNTLTCDVDGENAPSTTTWANISEAFGNVTIKHEKDILKNAEYTKTGSGSSTVVVAKEGTDQATAEAVAKYDYIVGKYNKGQGITAYNDFLNRDPAAIAGSNFNVFGANESNEVAAIVVIIAIASISAFGCLLILKKRKHQ